METNNVKDISIKGYLAERGIYPVKEYYGYGMYLSPYRNEQHPSFKVDYRKNLWRDFGAHEGGSIIDLVMKMRNCSYIEAIKLLDEKADLPLIFKTAFPSETESDGGMKLTETKPLEHPKLLMFLQELKVDTRIAQTYCKEPHYQVAGRNYYAIGFPNDTGGFAMRNCSFKGCKSPNNITTFDRETTTVHLFEGLIDYLSLLTMQPTQTSISSVILNSTGNLKKALLYLSKHKLFNAFLDNDEGGKQALEKLQKLNLPVRDISKRYAEFKDVNDYLCGKKLAKKQSEIAPKITKSKGFRR